MAFRKGGDAASEAAKKAGGGNFARTHWFSLPDGEQAVLRYLTDQPDWIFVNQHASVPTKNKPKGYEGNWPKSMPAVCRKDEAFEGKYKDCYICDAGIENAWGKKIGSTIRDWALAVLREEVVGTKAMFEAGDITEEQVGKRIGFKDQMREVTRTDKEGKETTTNEIAIVVVNMAPSNYFDGLNAIWATYKGQGMPGILDRDMVVRREGEGKDTEYYHTPLDPTPNLGPSTDRWAKYTKAIEDQGIDLEALITDRASDEYYGRFFDPSYVEPEKDGSSKSSSNSSSSSEDQDDAKDDGGPDKDRLAKMRERVRASSGANADVD